MNTYDQRLRERDARCYRSTRLWTPEPNKVGMPAEKRWHEWNGLPMDLRDHKYGDGGIDVVLTIRTPTLGPREFVSDVKGTERRDPFLCECPTKIENGKIYVLSLVMVDLRRANLMGWHWGYTLKQSPLMDRFGNGPCYALRWSVMRSMNELQGMIISARHSTPADSWWKANRRR
jgi:hypothetical protein